MFIVVTSPVKVKLDEDVVNRLFTIGLKILHLRKPDSTIDDYRTFLQGINMVYHDRIVIHHYPELCHEFGLKGYHLTESNREEMGSELEDFVRQTQDSGFTVSTAFHDLETLRLCEIPFDYHLLSPVLNSISKPDYLGKAFDVNNISKAVIGLGGIDSGNIGMIKDLGYNGVAVLGSIWEHNNPLEAFINIQEAYYKHYVTKAKGIEHFWIRS